MKCLECTRMDFKGDGSLGHRDMLDQGFGPCAGVPGPARTDGKPMTVWMALDKDRECAAFERADDEVIEARAQWRAKQAQKREAAV